MINPMNFLVRRMYMAQKGVPEDEATKFALVLSANDTPQQFGAQDLVLTHVVAVRKAEEFTPPPPKPANGRPPVGREPVPTAAEIKKVNKDVGALEDKVQNLERSLSTGFRKVERTLDKLSARIDALQPSSGTTPT
jgi:hypothetical protein